MFSKQKKILKILTILLLAIISFWVILRFSPYPGLSRLKKQWVSTRIYDSDGEIIQILPLENGIRREFLPLEKIPDYTKEAFIKAEDRHFYSHHGIDYSAIVRAFFQNASQGRRVSGASTITMQLARIIQPDTNRNMISKIREAFNALRLETRLSKDEILELYLNNIPFAFNTEGLASASRFFFNKEVNQLNIVESYCLSVIPRRPSFYNPLENPENCAKTAGELYLSTNENCNYSQEDFLITAKNASSFSYPFEMPHFIRYLSNINESPLGKKSEIYTSVNLKLQKKAEDLLAQNIEEYKGNRLTNGAIILIDNETGAILCWVGSADFFDKRHNGQVDGVLSTQQPGSSMKPFLYALALESGFAPASTLKDIPMEFGFENLYVPQNFNNRFNGPVRFRVALASSLNIPAVYILNEIGINKYLEKLYDLGFDSLKKSDPGLSLALGGADVSIFEMTQAFSVFPRDGLFLSLYAIEDENYKKKQIEKRVYDLNTARIICDILSDKDARALGFGYNQTFSTPFPSMFKTGTANQYQNITALGATPKYTVGVWMGNFSGETVVGKTGSSIPAKIAKELLVYVQGKDGKKFLQPPQFKKEKICALSGMRATKYCPDTVKEYVKITNEKIDECNWHREEGTFFPSDYTTWFRLKNRSGEINDRDSNLKITSPRNGSLYYYDESIPSFQQKLVVEASGGSEEKAIFYVDGKKAGESKRPLLFQIPLTRGNHKIQVECGQETDEIFITVK